MKKDLPRCMRKFLYLLIRPLRVVGVGGGGFCVGVSMKILVDGSAWAEMECIPD